MLLNITSLCENNRIDYKILSAHPTKCSLRYIGGNVISFRRYNTHAIVIVGCSFEACEDTVNLIVLHDGIEVKMYSS